MIWWLKLGTIYDIRRSIRLGQPLQIGAIKVLISAERELKNSFDLGSLT